MAFQSIKDITGDKKKVFFFGLFLYFLFLGIVLLFTPPPTGSSDASMDDQIWGNALKLSIPAGIASIITSYLGNQRKIGLVVVGCAGLIIALVSIIIFVGITLNGWSGELDFDSLLFGIVGVGLLAMLFFTPIMILSGVVAVISSYLGYLIRQIVKNKNVKWEYLGIDMEWLK